jgi:hypothetical protein
VSVTGGHFGAGLGVVELTTAIHYIFDTPRDRLIWGRRPPGLSRTNPDRPPRPHPHLRTGGGLSGFTKRTESDYDPFGAAPLLDLDLRRRSAWPLRATSPAGKNNVHRRDRRRRDVCRHGL